MGQISYVSDVLLERVLRDNYGIECVCVLPMEFGISDTTYHIVDVGGRSYFGKLYEGVGFARVFYELRVLSYLRSNGFSVSDVVLRRGRVSGLSSFVSSICGKPFCVFDFIDGCSPICVDSYHIEGLASFLGSFHNLSLVRGFVPFRSYLLVGRLYYLFNSLFSLGGVVCEEVLDIFSPYFGILGNISYVCEDGIIHGDLFPDNVHFSGEDLLGVFDFSSCCVGSFYFDLGVVVASWCMEGEYFSSSLFELFIGVYREYYLGDICLFELFSWLRFSILFFALQRYWMEVFRGIDSLQGKTYREYILKLVSLGGIYEY